VPALRYPRPRSPRTAVSIRAGTQAPSHRRRWGLLDELLMTALDAALPLDEPHAAPRIKQDLHLHVPGPTEVFLHEKIGISEVRECDATSRLERRRDLRRSIDPRHPDPTAARGRLEEHRVPISGGDDSSLFDRLERSVYARRDGHPEAGHRLSRGNLVAREGHRVGGRAHEDQTFLGAACREGRILRQEPVAG